MVGTLIKHEAVRTRGLLGTIFGAATLLALGGAVLVFLDWPVLAQFGLVLCFAGAIGVMPAVQLGLAVDYWRSSYRGVGYFTQTLPIKGGTIYWAKLLWAFLVSLVGILWAGVLGLVTASAMLRESPFAVLAEAWAGFRGFLETLPQWTWAPLVLLGLVALLLPLVEYFFAASVGSEKRLVSLGAGGPVLVWFLLYMVMSVVSLIAIVAIPLGLTADAGGVRLAAADYLGMILTDSDPNSVPVGFVPVFVLFVVLLVWRTVVSWNKKVSLA